MATNDTGANSTMAQHLLSEIISGGINFILVDQTPLYTDGDVDLSKVVTEAIPETDLQVNPASGFDDAAIIEVTAEHAIDVSAETATVQEAVIQNQSDVDRFVLADETNNPDLSQIDTYTIEAGTTIYEFGHVA